MISRMRMMLAAIVLASAIIMVLHEIVQDEVPLRHTTQVCIASIGTGILCFICLIAYFVRMMHIRIAAQRTKALVISCLMNVLAVILYVYLQCINALVYAAIGCEIIGAWTHWAYVLTRKQLLHERSLTRAFLAARKRWIPILNWLGLGSRFPALLRHFVYPSLHQGVDTRIWRNRLTVHPDQNVRIQTGNPHGAAAAERSAVRTLIINVANAVGLPLYFISMSNVDIKQGYSGTRFDHDVKDSVSYNASRNDPIPDGPYSRVYLDTVDHVDEEDLNEDLMDDRAHFVIGGQHFHDVAGFDCEIPFNYNTPAPADGYPHGTWSYGVQGSGYRHRVYDWEGETRTSVQFTYDSAKALAISMAIGLSSLLLSGGWYWAYVVACSIITQVVCFRARAVVRKLERRDVGSHRTIVVLVPCKVYGTIRTLLILPFVNDGLKRLEPTSVKITQSTMLAMRVKKGIDSYTSIAYEGFADAIRVTDKVGSIVTAIYNENPKQTPSASQVCQWSDKEKITLTQYEATLASQFFTKSIKATETSHLVRKSEPLFAFTMGKADSDAKDELGLGVRPIMNPIISGGAYAPKKNLENEKATVASRVQEMRNTAMLDPFVDKCMNEFVECLQKATVDKTGRLYLATEEEVYANQPRPAQQALLNRARNDYYSKDAKVAQSFQKAEPLKSAQPARNITTSDPSTRFLGARIEYSLGKAMKGVRSYVFGRNLRQVGTAMAEMYAKAQWALDCDYRNMDGSVGAIERDLDQRVRAALFHPSEHLAVNHSVQACFGNRVYSRFGTQYEQGTTQGSGFPDTSTGNTIRNMFIAFLALRKAGYAPGEAWDRMGLYGGDDGSTPDLEKHHMEWAAAICGKSIKCVVIPRGEPVPLLGRLYGECWYGSANSMCDIERQLVKIHLTTRPVTVSDDVIVADNGRNFLLTDRNTPLIGDVALAMAARSDHAGTELKWGVSEEAESQPMNVRADWMAARVEAFLDPQELVVLQEALASNAWPLPTVQYRDPKIKDGMGSAVINGLLVEGTAIPVTPLTCASADPHDMTTHFVPEPKGKRPAKPPARKESNATEPDNQAGPRSKKERKKHSKNSHKLWQIAKAQGSEALKEYYRLKDEKRSQKKQRGSTKGTPVSANP